MKTKKSNKIGKAFQNGLLGLAIISLALGSMFWITLVRYSLFIFLIGTLGTVLYLMESLTSHYGNKKLSKLNIAFGFIGIIFLMLSLGMQFSQLPFKNFILLIGIILLAFGLSKFYKN